MSTAALIFVLTSAALHALWNALVAGAKDTHVTTAVALTAGALVFAIPAALTWDVDQQAVPYIVASAALELLYFVLLAAAYSRAEYTFVYPIARGVAPVLVLVISVLFLDAKVGLPAALGVLAVTGGVLLVRGLRGSGADAAALAFALGVGACIAGYTLVDDHGVRHAGAIPYFECILVLVAVPYVVTIAVRRGVAPVLVLVISVLFLDAKVGLPAALGVLAVTGGVLLVRGLRGSGADAAALAFALGVGACIAGYTLVDDHGVRHAGAISYFECILVLVAVPYVTTIALRRGIAPMRAAVDRRSLPAGGAMVAAYVLVLAALERAEAAPVAALRETSVVMAAAGAAIAGREKVPPARIAGAVLVVAGIAAIALG